MIRKLWDIVSILAVANILAMGVLVLVLAMTGGLSANKLRLVRDVIGGRPLPVPEAPTQGAAADGSDLATAGQMIAREQTQTQILQLQIDQQLRELKDFQLQLDQKRDALDARIAQLEQDRRYWLAQRDAENTLLESEGFRKTLAIYEAMPPDQAKDLFMTLDDAEVVRFLSAMDERKAAKIAKAFTTDVEKVRLRKVLERMEKPLAGLDVPAGLAGQG